jgi:regulator-associated protein of mTOR
MRDPTTDMEHISQQPTNGSTAPRRNPNKSARVAFGPELETTIPSRERSPAPLAGHHRSFTTVEQRQPSLALPGRPTSSSGENVSSGIDSDAPPRRPSPRRSESSRPAMLKRARSDYGPSRITFDKAPGDDDEDFAMRHGWQEEYTSSEYLKILHSVRSIILHCGSQRLTQLSALTRISTCTSPRSATKPTVFPETRLEAGLVRTGA